MSQKVMAVILMSSMMVISIATIYSCINIAVAQFNSNIPFIPSTGQSPSSLSPPSSSSPSSPPSSPSSSSSPSSPPSSQTVPPPPPAMWPPLSPLTDCERNPDDPSCIPRLSPGPEQPANANQAPGGNVAVNSSTISSPPRPILVGPSSFTGSPITSGIQGNENATSIPSSNGLFLGSAER